MKPQTVGGQRRLGLSHGGGEGELLGGCGRGGRKKFFDEVELPLACDLGCKSGSG